jgi:hypothetical protein
MVGGNFKMGKTRQPKNYSNENIKENKKIKQRYHFNQKFTIQTKCIKHSTWSTLSVSVKSTIHNNLLWVESRLLYSDTKTSTSRTGLPRN